VSAAWRKWIIGSLEHAGREMIMPGDEKPEAKKPWWTGKFFVREESERARVWDQHYRASGRVPPYTEYPDTPDGPYKRGYWVDSEWPSDYEQQAKAA